MANRDLPNGFRAVGTLWGNELPGPREYPAASGEDFVVGAVVALSSNYLVNPTTTVGSLLGVVAGQNGVTRLGDTAVSSTTTGQKIKVWDYPHTMFEAQTSGTATSAMIGKLVDWEGAAGSQEINEDATTEKTFMIREIVTGPTESRGNQAIGTNSLVRVTIAKHQAGLYPDQTA